MNHIGYGLYWTWLESHYLLKMGSFCLLYIFILITDICDQLIETIISNLNQLRSILKKCLSGYFNTNRVYELAPSMGGAPARVWLGQKQEAAASMWPI